MASAQSITIDGTAPRLNQPGIASTSTGKPLINIVKPTAGVSHNRYGALNTTAGAVFNNSTVAGTTVTGGTAGANPNLAGSPTARIILNEVRGAATSMAGSNEIFGAKADLIIANENGITCNGCVFVNTGRATLTTGAPTVTDGVVSLDVRKGAVAIGRAGASGGDKINLIGRTVKIDGPVTSGAIDAIGGATIYNPETGAYSVGTPTGVAGGYVSVDATAFGAMTAGSIRIIGTEAGLGVRSTGNLKSTVGGITLSSKGNLEYKNVSTKTGLYVNATTTAHQRKGTVTAGTTARIIAGDVTQQFGASLVAGTSIDIDASRTITLAGEMTAPAITADSVGRFANYGTIIATGDVTVVAGEVFNIRPDEYVPNDWNVDAPADGIFVGHLFYDPLAMLNVTASAWNDRLSNSGDGGVIAANNLSLTSRIGDIQSSGVMIAANNALLDAKGKVYQRSVRGVYRPADSGIYQKTDLTKERSAETRAAILAALGTDAAWAYDVVRGGLVSGAYFYSPTETYAGNTLTVRGATGVELWGGRFMARNNVLVESPQSINLQSWGRYAMAQSRTARVDVVAQNDLRLTSAQIIAPTTMRLHAQDDLTIDQASADAARYRDIFLRGWGSSFDNPYTIDTDGYVNIAVSGLLTNNKTITAAGNIDLQSSTSEVRQNGVVTAGGYAKLQSAGNLTAVNTVAAGLLSLKSTAGSITVDLNARANGGAMVLDAFNHIITDTGATLYARDGIDATAGLSFTAYNSRIWSHGDISVLAGQRGAGSITLTHTTAVPASGYVRTYGTGKNLTLQTAAGTIRLTNNAAIATGNVLLDASHEIWVTRSVVEGATARLNGRYNYIVNEHGSRIEATTGGVVLNGPVGIYNRYDSSIIAALDVYARGNHFYNHGGTVTAGRDARLLPIYRFENHKWSTFAGSISAGRNVEIKTDTDYIWNVDSNVTAGGTLTLDAGAHQVNTRAVLNAVGAAVVNSNNYTDFTASSLIAASISGDQTNYIVLNPGSRLQARSGDITLKMGGIFYNRDSVVTTPGAVSVTSGGVENDGSVIRAGTTLTMNSAGHWRNVDAYGKAGNISAGGAISVNATAGGYVWNRGSSLVAGGNLTTRSAANTHNERSTVTALAGAALIRSTGEFRQTAGLLKARSVTVDSEHHLYMFSGGRMEATAGSALFDAVYDFNIQDSAIVATGDIALARARHIYLYDTDLRAGGDISLTTAGLIQHRIWDTDRTTSVAGGDITMTAGAYIQNFRADMTAGGSVLLTSTADYVDNYGGTIRAGLDVTMTGSGIVHNRNYIETGTIVAGRHLEMRSTNSQVYLQDSIAQAGSWLKLIGKTSPYITAAAVTNASYLHLNVSVLGGNYINPFTVDTTGAVDFYASGSLTNTLLVRGDNYVRLRTGAGALVNSGTVRSDTNWVTLESGGDLTTNVVIAAKAALVKSNAGSVINTGWMQAGETLTIDAFTDFRNVARVAANRNLVRGDTGISVSAGQNVDLTNTLVDARGNSTILAGQRVKGNLTIKTTHLATPAQVSVAAGKTLTMNANAAGDVDLQGAKITGGGIVSSYAGGVIRSAAIAAVGGTVTNEITATSLYMSGASLDLDQVTTNLTSTLRLVGRTGGITGTGGSMSASSISLSSLGAAQDINISGLALIEADDRILIESERYATVGATNIRAVRYDFTDTITNTLSGAVHQTGSVDLALVALYNLALNGTTSKRNITLTSTAGQVANFGTLSAGNILRLVSNVAPAQVIATHVGLDATAANWLGVRNEGRLFATAAVQILSNRSVEAGFVRSRDIDIRSVRADVTASAAMIASRNLTLRAGADIDVRSVFADAMTVTADEGSFRVSGWTATDTNNFKTGKAEFANLMSARIGSVGTELTQTPEADVITEANVNAAFRNSDSTLFHSATDLTLTVKQDVIALNGAMISGEGDVNITAGRDITVTSMVENRGAALDDRLARSGILADGALLLTAGRTIRNTAGSISSKENMYVTASGSIVNDALKTYFVLKAEHDCEGNACGRKGFVFTPGEFMSGSGIIMTSRGGITNRASQIAAAGSLTLHAGGSIVNTSLQGEYNLVDVYERKRFLFITISTLVKVVNVAEIGSAVIQTEFGDVFLRADTGDVQNIGSILSSGNNLEVTAGRDIVLNAVSEEVENVYKKSGFKGFGYSSNKTYWNNFATAFSQLEAADSIKLEAGQDIAGIGATIMALNDVDMAAGRDVVYDAKQNAKYKIDSGWSIGFSSGGFPITTALLNSGTSGAISAYIADNPAIAAVHKLATARDGWGTVNGSLALLWHGSQTLADANALFRQIGGQSSISESLARQFIPTDYKTFTSLTTACRDAILSASCAAAVGISFRIESWKTKQTWTETYISQIGAGRDLTINATRDIVLAGGSVVSAARNVTIDAGRHFAMTAVADNSETTSRSWGLSISAGQSGVTIGGHAEGSRVNQTIFSNASLTAGGTLIASAASDMRFLGARVKARDIFLDAGRDLSVASRQNTADSSSWGFNASVTFTGTSPSGFSIGANVGKGQRYFTDTPTWIQATAINDIHVGRTTYLMGAVLSSGTNSLVLDTGSFLFDNYDNRDLNWSVGGSVSLGNTGWQSLSGSANATYRNIEGITYATVAGGRVRVRDNLDVHLATLNTDITNITRETRNTYISIEIPGINLATLRDNLEASGNFLRAATANVPDEVRNRGGSAVLIYQRMVANGLTVSQAMTLANSAQFREAVALANETSAAIAAYGSWDAIPRGVKLRIANGEALLYRTVDGQIQAGLRYACDTSASYCWVRFPTEEPESVLAEAGAAIAGLIPQIEALRGRATLTPQQRVQLAQLEGELTRQMSYYALCAEDRGALLRSGLIPNSSYYVSFVAQANGYRVGGETLSEHFPQSEAAVIALWQTNRPLYNYLYQLWWGGSDGRLVDAMLLLNGSSSVQNPAARVQMIQRAAQNFAELGLFEAPRNIPAMRLAMEGLSEIDRLVYIATLDQAWYARNLPIAERVQQAQILAAALIALPLLAEAAAAYGPTLVSALMNCVRDFTCRTEVATDILLGDSLGGAALVPAISGTGVLLLRRGETIVGIISPGGTLVPRPAGMTAEVFSDLYYAGRGLRPAPTTYLSTTYIANHLAAFNGGAVRVGRLNEFAEYGTAGRANGFVMPRSDWDRVWRETGGDLRQIEARLGFDAGYLTPGNVGVAQISPSNLGQIRMSTGNEAGANLNWIPGGYTSGGVREAVVPNLNSVPFTIIQSF